MSFSLVRGGVIAGRIVDDSGDPVSGTQVSAVRYAFMGGARRLMPAPAEGSSDRTDDQGGFRLFGLPPGDYFVSATNRSGNFMMADVSNTEADGFAPTYYPGAASLAEATRITLKTGQEMTGANFALIIARLARIKGRAVNSRGEPVPRSMLMMTPADPSQMSSVSMNNAMAGADGTFQFSNVAPGRYVINLRPNGMPTANSEFAAMPITVGNDDIDNVILTSSVGATATGIVSTDDGSVPPFRADQVQVSANPAEPMVMMFGNQQKMNDDFTFELSGPSDRRIIRAGAPPGWYLKAVFLSSDDITDSGLEFVPGRAVEGLQVVLTQKTTDLSGLVTDDRNRPVVDASVVIFPANQDRWTYNSRYIRTMRPDTNGRYNIKSLPPAEDYLMIAVQNLESGQGADLEFLNRAREEAKTLSLNEGETKAVDVKLSRLVP